MNAVSNIKDPILFLGVATALGVPVKNTLQETEERHGQVVPKEEARDFVDIFADVMEKYSTMGRDKKRKLLRILEKANKHDVVKGELNGNRTENTEENSAE